MEGGEGTEAGAGALTVWEAGAGAEPVGTGDGLVEAGAGTVGAGDGVGPVGTGAVGIIGAFVAGTAMAEVAAALLDAGTRGVFSDESANALTQLGARPYITTLPEEEVAAPDTELS